MSRLLPYETILKAREGDPEADPTKPHPMIAAFLLFKPFAIVAASVSLLLYLVT